MSNHTEIDLLIMKSRALTFARHTNEIWFVSIDPITEKLQCSRDWYLIENDLHNAIIYSTTQSLTI